MRLTYWLTVWWLRYSRAAISRSARPSTTSPATPTSRAVGAASGADASPGSSRSSSSTETSVPPSPGTGPEWAWMVAPSPVRRVTSNRREKPVLVQLVAGRASSRCRCSSAARTSASSARAAAFSRTSGERGSLMMIAVPASLSAASAWSRACWMRSRVLIAEIADPRIRPRAPAERSSRGPNSRPGSLRASAARRPCPHPPGWHLDQVAHGVGAVGVPVETRYIGTSISRPKRARKLRSSAQPSSKPAADLRRPQRHRGDPVAAPRRAIASGLRSSLP